jgi:hypothetical protein
LTAKLDSKLSYESGTFITKIQPQLTIEAYTNYTPIVTSTSNNPSLPIFEDVLLESGIQFPTEEEIHFKA